MKPLKIALLALVVSSAYAETNLSDLQTTVTIERSAKSFYDRQLTKGREDLSFKFDEIHSLLQESRDQNKPTMVTLPLGSNEMAEFTVRATTKHIGLIVWKNGRFAPVEYPYVGFDGTTQAGDRVRGFISDQSFSAIIHSVKVGRILVQSKSLEIENDSSNALRNIGFEEPETLPSAKTLFSPLQPTQFQSPVDAGGHVQLRHIGLLFTLTDNAFHAIDPTGNISNWGNSQIVRDWATNFSFRINDILMSQLGITIDPIGSTPELDGVRYIVQPKGGYPGQPVDSIFGGLLVPNTRIGWAYANRNFQKWVVENGGTSPGWWDLGMAIGYDTNNPATTDPLGGVVVPIGNLCGTFKGGAYTSLSNVSNGAPGTTSDLLMAIHELGHVMGAEHTFSSSHGTCGDLGQLSSGSAVEPGSGSTLMGYAGLCAPDNVQMDDDAYFHGKSIEQINTFFNNLENTSTCISHALTQNRPPVIGTSAYPDRNIIPKGVRFTLKTLFTDPDLDDQINQNPSSVSNTIKSEGAGKVTWEQIDSLADTTTLGPRYRSFPAKTANNPTPFVPNPIGGYRKGYVRSFPDESHPSGAPWDPLITDWDTVNYPIGVMNFRATGWDYNANAGAGFPGFASADVPVIISNSEKPVFNFPTTNQVINTWETYTINWTPNFAATQPNFTSIALAYKHPKFGWITLDTKYNAPSNWNSFSNIKFAEYTSIFHPPSYTTSLRLEYATSGDVIWYVESPEFKVTLDKVFSSGFEESTVP